MTIEQTIAEIEMLNVWHLASVAWKKGEDITRYMDIYKQQSNIYYGEMEKQYEG